MLQIIFTDVRIKVFTFANACDTLITTTEKEVNKMFEQLDMETIGYFNYMEQEEKKQNEEKERLQHDLRIPQNQYQRTALRQRNQRNNELL